jgi:Protein of unknown function (DUF3102)
MGFSNAVSRKIDMTNSDAFEDSSGPDEADANSRAVAMSAVVEDIDADSASAMTASRFNYETVDREVADKLRDRASRISSLNTKATETILAVGRELIQAKAQIDHGDFAGWVEAEAHISIRAAQHYMAVARFADQENKSATISLFAPATAYRLVSKSVPHEIRTAVLERAEAGDILPDNEITDMIDRAKEARKPIIKEKRRVESKRFREQRRLHREEWEAREKREKEADEAKARSILQNLGLDNVRSFLEALGNDYRRLRVLDHLEAIASESENAAAATAPEAYHPSEDEKRRGGFRTAYVSANERAAKEATPPSTGVEIEHRAE